MVERQEHMLVQHQSLQVKQSLPLTGSSTTGSSSSTYEEILWQKQSYILCVNVSVCVCALVSWCVCTCMYLWYPIPEHVMKTCVGSVVPCVGDASQQ